MNTKTIFKKPRVIITAIVLALLVALAAVVVILASDTAEFQGVQVTTDGKINMIWWFSVDEANKNDVTTAEVVIKDGGTLSRSETVDLQYDETSGLYYVQVRLAAAEMLYDVTVTPKNGILNACTVESYSIRKYADTVFANADALIAAEKMTATDVAVLKSILNYGHFAKEYFAANTDAVFANQADVNDGLYTRKTNPIIGMDSKLTAGSTALSLSVASGYEEYIQNPELEVVLNDSIELRLSYEWIGGDESHSGTYDEDTQRYYVSVYNISTEDFDTDYSNYLIVNVSAQKAIEISGASVYNCMYALSQMEEEYANELALAMYNYYYWTNDDKVAAIDQGTCKHFMHYEPTAIGSDYSHPVCSFCGFEVDSVVHNSVNYYSAPGQFNNYWGTGASGTTMLMKNEFIQSYLSEDDGTVYSRIYAFQSGNVEFTNGTATQAMIGNVNASYHDKKADYKLDGGMGQYIVIKMRTSKAVYNKDDIHNTFKLGFTTDPTATANATETTRTGTTHNDIYYQKNFGGWTTYVIDIEKLGNAAFSDAITNKTLSSIDAIDATISFAGSGPASQDAIDEAVAGGAYQAGYTDIAYFAICDDLTEVATLTGDDQVYFTNWSSSAYDNYATVDGTNKKIVCDTHRVTSSVNGAVHTHTCKVCGEVVTNTLDVSDDINFYSAPGQVYNNWAMGIPTNSGTASSFNNIGVDGDTVYTRVYSSVGGSLEFGNITAATTTRGYAVNGYRASGNPLDEGWAVKNGTGNYLVLKVRGHDITQLKFFLNATDDDKAVLANGTTHNETNLRYVDEEIEGTWVTYVFDLAKLNITHYPAGQTEATHFCVGLQIETGTEAISGREYLDIAYFAACDTWDEVASLTKNGAVKLVDSAWKDGATLVDRDYDGTCLNDACVLTNKAIAVSGSTVKYVCPNCNVEVLKTLELPTIGSAEGQVNYYSAPGMAASKWVGAGYTYSQFTASQGYTILDDQDRFYARYGIGHTGGSFWLKDDTAAGGMDAIAKSGRYAVIRLRSDMIDRIAFCAVNIDTSTVAGYKDDNVAGNSYRNDDYSEWATYVIDLTGINKSSSTSDGVTVTYYPYVVGSDSTTAKFWIQTNVGASGYGSIYDNLYIKDAENPWYIDIEYFALCDDWDAIKSVVGTDDVWLTNWVYPAGDTFYKNGKCDECTYEYTGVTDDGKHLYTCTNPLCQSTTTDENHTYDAYYTDSSFEVKCTMCGVSKETRTIDDSINYYSAPGLFKTGHNTGTTTLVVDDDETGFAYTRIKFGLSGSIRLHNSKNNTGDLTVADDTIKGAGRFAVMKIRVDDKSLIGGLKIGLYNGDDELPSYTYAVWKYTADELKAFVHNSANGYYYTGCTKVADANGYKLDSDGNATTEQWTEAELATYKLNTNDNCYYSGGNKIAKSDGTALASTSTDTKDVTTAVRYLDWMSTNHKHADNIFSSSRDQANLVNDEWVTYVIDLSELKFGATYYQNDKRPTQNADRTWDTNQRYYSYYDICDMYQDNISVGLQINANVSSTISNVDLAYFAIVDDWDEVKLVTGENTDVTFTNWKSSTNDKALNTTTSDPCSSGHSVVKDVVELADGTYGYAWVCKFCNELIVDTTYNVTVGAGEGQLNALRLPGDFNVAGSWHSILVSQYAVGTDGIPYTRFKQTDSQGGDYTSNSIKYSYNAAILSMFGYSGGPYEDLGYGRVQGGSGTYLVFKIKTTGINGLELILGTDYAQGLNCSTTYKQTWSSFNDDQWHVIVVDLAAFKAVYNLDDSRLNLGEDVTSINASLVTYYADITNGNYMDVAYVALCDDLAELQSVVGDEDMVFTNWKNLTTAPVFNFSDDGVGDEACAHESYTLISSTPCEYIYKCSACAHRKIVEIPRIGAGDGINFYSVAGQQYNNWHTGPVVTDTNGTHVGTVKYYEAENGEGFIYNSITMDESGGMTLFNTGAVRAGITTNTNNTLYGTGNYIVLKVRTSTTYKNDPTNTTYGDGQCLKIGAYQAGNTANAGNGDPVYDNNIKVVTQGEWVTYVVDMSFFTNSYYTAGGTDTTTAAFGLKIGNSYLGTVDLAYFAVCDNWAEIDSLVGNDTVVLTGWDSTTKTVGDQTVTLEDTTLTAAEVDAKVAEEAAAQ